MPGLNRATSRRLQQLKQTLSIWEGDRLVLPQAEGADGEDELSHGECVLWVDATDGMVRAMDVVPSDIGSEAIVRTLLRAMEHPHSPAQPARPKRILVRDREIQFFLRGVVQDLGINVDYVPELPLIDEIYGGFLASVGSRPPELPDEYADLVLEQAMELWNYAPWQLLSEDQVITVTLNQWDIETLYISIMGMLGMEYGLLMYRSLDSLKQFRRRAMDQGSMEEMQEAFLQQDCLFLTFEQDDDHDDREPRSTPPPADKVQPSFGNLHPLEGMRSFLYEEEAIAVFATLLSLNRFFKQHRRKLGGTNFPDISSQYQIPLPATSSGQLKLSVQVATLPDVSKELLAMSNDEGDGAEVSAPVIKDDLVPDGAFLSLGMLAWDKVEVLRKTANFYQQASGKILQKGDGLPVILIQTSLPKAKVMIETLQTAGGLKAICFNPGEDPFQEQYYDLGLLQTENEDLHLFGEFAATDPNHQDARQKWDRRCKATKGYCGLVIAKGLTGNSRGNPQFRDMLALFEAKSISEKELGMGPLEMHMEVDWI